MEWKKTTIAFSFTGRIVVRPRISEQAEEVGSGLGGGGGGDLGGRSRLRLSLDGHAAPVRFLRPGEQEGPARHVSLVGDRNHVDRVRSQNSVHPAWKVLIIVIFYSCDLGASFQLEILIVRTALPINILLSSLPRTEQ